MTERALAAPYAAWITEHDDPADPLRGRGKCQERSTAMARAFPELRVVAGYYYDAHWGPQQHWWCVAPDGTVVDPTAAQFPTAGRGGYEELAPEERPVGTCMDCGEDVFAQYTDDDGAVVANPSAPTFCSPRCERATRAYLGV